jgi:hypothetical protein
MNTENLTATAGPLWPGKATRLIPFFFGGGGGFGV